jgi:hypothetical protein
MRETITKQINKGMKILEKQMKEIQKVDSVLEWTKAKCINQVHKGTGAIGVYKIIHRPSNKVMSIGQGNIGARKARHLGVFRNDGQTLISKNGKPSGSVTGQKMFEFDSNENNWDFSLLAVGSKFLSCFIEEDLQAKLRPAFNADHMGGK